MMHFGSRYPWMTDPNWTDVWVADKKYIDNTSGCANWYPMKGSNVFVQSTSSKRPTWAADYGSRNVGSLTFDGVDDWMSCDAIGALLSGRTPYTLFASFWIPNVTSSHRIFFASDTSDSINAFNIFHATSAGHSWTYASTSSDGVTVSQAMLSGPSGAGNVAFVHSQKHDSGHASRIEFALTDPGTAYGNETGMADAKTQTISKLTLAAFRGATTSLFQNIKVRSFGFAPVFMSASTNEYKRVLTFLNNEMA